MDIFSYYRLSDLTHALSEEVPTWSGRCGFRLETKIDYHDGIKVQSIKSHAGVGTHIDAPSHFFCGAPNIGDLDLASLFVPICVVDVSKNAGADFFVSPRDIEVYEKTYGAIQSNTLVIARTGWERFWDAPVLYRNADASGNMHFPGFSLDSVRLLLERNIAGIGIDTLSPDGSNTKEFPVHLALLGAGKYILENLANLSSLPSKGAYAICLPPKLKDATESTLRVAALIPKVGCAAD